MEGSVVTLTGIEDQMKLQSFMLSRPAIIALAVVAILTLVLVMVFAKIMDRTPATLDEMHLLQHTPQTLVYVMLSLEEILEFALPLFATVALLQCRLLGQRQHAET